MPRKDAPYKSYKVTEEDAYNDGYECGYTWKIRFPGPGNGYLPGGPYVSPVGTNREPCWIDYCNRTAVNNAAWKRGYANGFAAYVAGKRYRPVEHTNTMTDILDGTISLGRSILRMSY